MVIDYNLLAKKLELLKGYLSELKDLLAFGKNEILTDSLKYHSLERVFQLCVDTMIDINIHLIREMGNKTPDDLTSTFISLSEINVLPVDFAQKISKIVGLRNMIVHRYEKLDRDIFVDHLTKNFADLEKYYQIVTALVKEE